MREADTAAALRRSPALRRQFELFGEIASARIRRDFAGSMTNDYSAKVDRLHARVLTAKPIEMLELEVQIRGAEHDLQRWAAEYRRWREEVDRLESEQRYLAKVSA